MPRAHRTRPLVALLAAALLSASSGAAAVAADTSPAPDICLTVGLPDLDDATIEAIRASVSAAFATRPVLIPAPSMVSSGGADPEVAERALRLAVWTDAADAPLAGDPGAGCGADSVDDGTWRASITGAFLRAGTKRELAAAGTTPGFTSDIDVEWDEAAERVRTVLTFSGPLGIPNGTCWMDDVVAADGQGGTHAETSTGSETSPFGDGVCGRFEQYLADGGAGAQALVLLPRVVDLVDGGALRLGVDGVDVRDDGVHLWGSVEAGPS